jgi:Phospholipase/Carboxylesterase
MHALDDILIHTLQTLQVLGGFSMGGGLALQCLTKPWVHGLAGLFSLSSFLAEPSAAYSEQHSTQLPLYIAHGLQDGLVPAHWGRMTAQRLRSVYTDLQHIEYDDLDHELGEQELEQLAQWILARHSAASSSSSSSAADSSNTAAAAAAVDSANSADASSSSSNSHASTSAAAPVRCTVQTDGDSSTATFWVPAAMQEALTAHPLTARGSFFQLEHGSESGTVTATFESPKPELTASALAARIEARLADPTPPGAEACTVC